ncbi:hypothetical protein [Pseudozobellia thermophila]|uniref:Uncharacterized protein n=1 Tax=Pseudozobellia thermophila TaxID=192903 RepID=A0A1M6ML59_9FLAO|nr:hypothetical protein [Pseudozobellia thermophila]SHJ84013.1 hypothetical protein SAMN04488513_11034 [Pseudozobellia thermophila]
MKGLTSEHSDHFDFLSKVSERKSKHHYRLVDFKNKQHKTDFLLSQTKCNLEIFPEGLVIVGDFTEKEGVIPVLKSEINSITVVRGKEIIDTFYLSPMYILSKLGVPNRISRHLMVYPSEYRISETRIMLKCQNYQLTLVTSGNRFDRLLRNLKKSGYSGLLKLVERPKINMLDYKNAIDL